MAFGFGGAPGVPQGLSADDIKRLLAQQAGVPGAPPMTAPDQGQPPAPSIPFGFGAPPFGAPSMPGALPPQTMGAAPMPPTRPPGLGYDPLVAENEAATRAAEQQLHMVPQASPVRAPRPLSFGAPAQPAPAPSASPQFLADDAPMPNVRVPLPPARPNFGLVPGVTAQADMPAADAVPTAGTMPAPTAQPAAPDAPGFSFGNLFQKLGESGVGDTLIGLGTGLMSTKGFGNGLAVGFQNAQKYNAQRSVSDLARAELALKTGKVQRETEATNLTRQSLIRGGHDEAKVDLALAASRAGHSEALNNLLKTAVPAPREAPWDWQKQADGSYSPTVGGPQDPDRIAAQAKAREADKTQTPLTDPDARLRAGIPANDTRPAWADPDGRVTFNEGPKAQVATMVGPRGEKVSRIFNPATGTFDEPNYGSSPPQVTIDNSGVPPGVDPATYRKELAKATVKEEQAASQRATQAVGAMPIIERAQQAYERLGKNGGIGPYAASGFNRTVTGVLGGQNEVDRQEYEAAAKDLELLKAQISMKGQGAITEGERKLLSLTLPRLDAASAATGLATLRGLRSSFNSAMTADRLPSYGSGRSQGAPQSSASPQAPVPAPAKAPGLRYQQLIGSGMSKDAAYARMREEGF